MLQKYIKKILASKVYDVARETPLQAAPLMSAGLNNQIWLKREDLQPVYSFKCRGAYNKIASLTDTEKAQGVITASAGNHAQGVALAAQKLGIKAVIVMGKNTPEIKVAAVKARGGKVILHGDTYDDAAIHAKQLVEQKGYVYIPPYDDVDVIAGQGTVGMEILRQQNQLDVVFVPVGGGGLIAGVAVFLKYLRPDIKVVGVEARGSHCLSAALAANRRVTLPADGLDLFADGASVAQVGKEPFAIAKTCVDEVMIVSTDEICAAIKDIYTDTRALTEPAGALAVAGMKQYIRKYKLQQKNLVAINSGANVNFDRLRHIAERAELGEKREALFAVTIPEQPGSFKTFCKALGKRNITEFNYRYTNAQQAKVFVGIQTKADINDKLTLFKGLADKNYDTVDLSDNEMAILHVRYMVGGAAPNVENECTFRFEFPERPGALMKFLNHLGQRWNISMFHYRNHGAAFGRVLVGIQVPKTQLNQLNSYLDEIGYPYWDETKNPAYQEFLA